MLIAQMISGLASLILFTQVNAASAPVVEARPLTIHEKIVMYAKKYDVSAEVMANIIKCENVGLDPKKQSNLIYDFSDERRGIIKGTREMSFGLSQIHLPDHPNVSYEEAINEDFALEFLAKNIKTNPEWWSCYKKLYL